MMTFQDMIAQLIHFWAQQGCVVHQGYDLEVGAGTFNPATFLRCLGPEPYSAVYVEPSRRPKDGRFGMNPNRLQFYHQMQVILKPSPKNVLDLYLQSLESIGLNLNDHDMRFVHDDWENPTIGAWGLGWEVWADGMEVTQFTYFQSVGGLPVKPVSGEITYGLERLAMYLQGVDSVFDLKWNDKLTYGEMYQRNEWEWSHYNFHEATTEMWLRHFDDFEKEAKQLIAKQLPLPAYDFVMKSSHAFNILEARGQLSVTERARYMARIRHLAKGVAECYLASREKLNFPLLIPTSHEEVLAPPLAPHQIDPKKQEDFLLEIGCEELPATFIPIGLLGLEQKMRQLLEREGITYTHLEVMGTPRRLAVLVQGVAEGTATQHKERKGPAIKAAFDAHGQPTQVGLGFLRSAGLSESTRPEDLEIRDGYIYVQTTLAGKSTRELLVQALPSLILGLEFPKMMRWGESTVSFARPIRWVVALFGQEVLPFVVADVVSHRTSYGHRQLAPAPIILQHPQEYCEKLRKSFVIAKVQERQDMILKNLPQHALAVEKVLPQVTHLVEYPFVMEGSFDPAYLKAPQQVLMSEMIEHQKYFPLGDGKDGLIARFCLVSNNRPTDLIQHGHEKALSPRLADGVFLYEEDLKVPLTKRHEQLKNMTYQAPLGSLATKVSRLVAFVKLLHEFLPLTPLEEVSRAAQLCKADLASLLVGEFPELQGVIGKLYALKQGETQQVATAIDEHWMPRGEGAPRPQTGAGILLSLADKLDNLISCFSLGLRPTSSSDPHALRRQAFGIIKILLDHKLHLPLPVVLKEAFVIFLANPELDPKVKIEVQGRWQEIAQEILDFLAARLRSVFVEEGFAKDEIESVLVFGVYSVYDLYLRLTALHTARQAPLFPDLLEVATRTKKILLSQQQNLRPSWQVTEVAHKEGRFPEVLEKELAHPAELALFTHLKDIRTQFHQDVLDRRDLSTRSYQKALQLLIELKEPVSAFFEAVKVIDDDIAIRNRRLALLQEVYDLCEECADFSKLAR